MDLSSTLRAQLRSESRAGGGAAELLAAAIIAAIDRPDGEVQGLPRVVLPAPRHLDLQWWIADRHTAPGRRATSRWA